MISVAAGSLVITPADYKTVYVNNPANRELVTLTECISAGSFHVPLIITFKSAYYFCKYFKNDIDGNILWTRSNSGFTNNKLTLL